MQIQLFYVTCFVELDSSEKQQVNYRSSKLECIPEAISGFWFDDKMLVSSTNFAIAALASALYK